ncbi:MAG: calcium-binding protein [Gammaproteobacteria bacterium]|nr:calcium-binding protein [Gammaproteobacteria bacterium]
MSFHLYDINELYSNADGSIQYIELVVGNSNGQSVFDGQTISVTGGAPTHSFTFPGNLPSSTTANTSVLIATQGFADLGIVTPDFIVPSGFLFTGGGTVDFAGVDSVTYAALPTDGTHSVNRSGMTITSSPENFAGDSGTVPGNPIAGTNGADNLMGTSAGDYIVGLKGNDLLDGEAGADTLQGGPGNDTYVVDSSGDVVTEAAAAGTDQVQTTATLSALAANVENLRLLGSAALDATGNALKNVIYANSGSNELDGGSGTDTLSYEFGAVSGVTLSLLSTSSQATGGSGSDTLTNIENLTGSSFADDLTGDAGANTLIGLAGADTLSGGAGNDKLKGKADADALAGGDGGDTLAGGGGDDTLAGGSGDDTLKGGAGSDTLQGDDGADIFLFNTALGVANLDTVVDFATAVDVIRLDNDIFKKLVTAPGLALKASEFAANADGEATQADDRIIYHTTTGELFYDRDGSGTKAAVLFATLEGAPTLDADDFFVVG